MRARPGYELTGVRAGTNSLSPKQTTIDWSPTDTRKINQCERLELKLGINETVRSAFRVCPRRFGLADIDANRFAIVWKGNRPSPKWEGLGGGAMYMMPRRQRTDFRFSLLRSGRPL